MNQSLPRDYIQDSPLTNFAQLREAFPQKIQGSYGVFEKLSIAENVYRESRRKRHYLKPSDYLFSVSENGVAAKELERQLGGVTYKCAWRIAKSVQLVSMWKATGTQTQ